MILLIEKVFDKQKNIHEEENVIKLFEQKVILAFLLVLRKSPWVFESLTIAKHARFLNLNVLGDNEPARKKAKDGDAKGAVSATRQLCPVFLPVSVINFMSNVSVLAFAGDCPAAEDHNVVAAVAGSGSAARAPEHRRADRRQPGRLHVAAHATASAAVGRQVGSACK